MLSLSFSQVLWNEYAPLCQPFREPHPPAVPGTCLHRPAAWTSAKGQQVRKTVPWLMMQQVEDQEVTNWGTFNMGEINMTVLTGMFYFEKIHPSVVNMLQTTKFEQCVLQIVFLQRVQHALSGFFFCDWIKWNKWSHREQKYFSAPCIRVSVLFSSLVCRQQAVRDSPCLNPNTLSALVCLSCQPLSCDSPRSLPLPNVNAHLLRFHLAPPKNSSHLLT